PYTCAYLIVDGRLSRSRSTNLLLHLSLEGLARGGETPQLGVSETGDEVVVHHPHRLHERVANRRSHEAEATLPELRTHAVGLPRPRGNLPQCFASMLLRHAAHKAPQERVEGAVCLLKVQEGAGVGQCGLDLLAVAHDPGVLQQSADP